MLIASLSLIFLISILSKNNFTMQTTPVTGVIAYLLDDVSASDDVIFITENNEEVTTEKIMTTIFKTTKKTTTTKAKKKNSDLTMKDGNVADKYVTKVDKQLAKLPDKIVKSLKDNKWSIFVTDKNLAKTYFNGYYSSVRAVTIYSRKLILIEDRDAAVNNSPLHEVGHYVDFISGWSSKTPEFKAIYKEEVEAFKKNIPNSGSVRDEQELFASIFCYYYMNSSKCTPKAKAYVKSIIDKL